MWDSAIGGIGGMISFGTFGIIGSTIASAGLGFVGSVGGDLIANNGNWNQVNWYKALVMGAVNGFAGFLSGPGLQNGKAVGEAIGSALSETVSYKAIITAAKRYGTGIGFQRTWNLYGNQVIFNALFVTPTIIANRKMITTLVMSASSIATVLFNWSNKYFNFWD